MARDALIRYGAAGRRTTLPTASLACLGGGIVCRRHRHASESAGQAAAESLLARADGLLTAVRADGLAEGSDLLPSGLPRRFAALAAEPSGLGADQPRQTRTAPRYARTALAQSRSLGPSGRPPSRRQ